MAWLLACFLVIQHPTINQVSHADAIVVLGPPETDRLDAGASGCSPPGSPTSSSSRFRPTASPSAERPVPRRRRRGHDDLLHAEPGHDPGRGGGDRPARSAVHHWKTVVVVTSKFHVSRARMIFDRCVDGQVEVVSSPAVDLVATLGVPVRLPDARAIVRAFLHPSC